MKSLQKAHKIIFICLLAMYFSYAARVLAREASRCAAQFAQMRTFSAQQKRQALLGDIVRFADMCAQIIPAHGRALLLINLPSRPDNEDFRLNYYLYPRKLYWISAVNAYPESLPALTRSDYCALQERGIDWIIYMYSEPLVMRKVVRLRDCRVAASYTIDLEKGRYVRDR